MSLPRTVREIPITRRVPAVYGIELVFYSSEGTKYRIQVARSVDDGSGTKPSSSTGTTLIYLRPPNTTFKDAFEEASTGYWYRGRLVDDSHEATGEWSPWFGVKPVELSAGVPADPRARVAIRLDRAGNVMQGDSEVFRETFELLADSFKWLDVGRATWTITSLVQTGLIGGKAYKAQGYVWKAFRLNIPYDPTKLYRMRTRARRTATENALNQEFYCGLEGVAADGETLVNIVGSDDHFSQHFFCAHNVDASAWTLNAWQEFTGWIKGTVFAPTQGPSTDPTTPRPMHEDVRYVRPLFGLNYYNGPVGNVMELDYIAIDVFDEEAQKRLYSTVSGAGYIASDTQMDADIWVNPANRVSIGTGGGTTPGVIKRTVHVGAHDFNPASDTQATYYDSAMIRNGTGEAGVARYWYAPLIVPDGAKIVKFRIRGWRAATADNVTVVLRRVSDTGSETAIATNILQVTGAAYGEKELTVSETIDVGQNYVFAAVLEGDTDVADARLMWAEVDIEISDYVQQM